LYLDRPDEKRLYIMTLGVLAPYRGRGVGSKLISSVLDYYESNKEGKSNLFLDKEAKNILKN